MREIKGKITMSQNVPLSVFGIVGNTLCITSDDGQKVFERIAAVLREGRSAAVSFMNVESMTSAFLNAAIGQLYGFFSEDDIRANIKLEDLQADDLALLKRVVETAKQYFRDRSQFRQAFREATGVEVDDEQS